ncbi:MAG: hypothetical protein MR356_09805 [Agathobacter sp.]|nr:hypothetical protein [Agathobacter sp.]
MLLLTILILALLTFLLGLAFKLTGAVLKAVLWVFIFLPIALVLWALAVVCCCTLILIPVGVFLFKAGMKLLIP